MFVRAPFIALGTTCDAPAVLYLPRKPPVACEDAEHWTLHMTANARALIGATEDGNLGQVTRRHAGGRDSLLTCEHLERAIVLVCRSLVSFSDDSLARLVALFVLNLAMFNIVVGRPQMPPFPRQAWQFSPSLDQMPTHHTNSAHIRDYAENQPQAVQQL
jgi:hypothetical protein